MIHSGLNITFYRPPRRWKGDPVFVKAGKSFIPNKHYEIEVLRENWWRIGFNFDLDFRRQAHAGLYVAVHLLNFSASLAVQDVRHWDYENDRWEEYPEGSDPKLFDGEHE